MARIGLLHVGAVLIVDGLMLLGRVDVHAVPRLRWPGVPAGPEPGPREGEPTGHGAGAPPAARVGGTVAESQRTRESTDTPSDRRR